MREREATAYYALKDDDGALRVCHAKVGKAPGGAMPITEAEALVIASDVRRREPRQEPKQPTAQDGSRHEEIDRRISALEDDLRRIFMANKAVIEGKV